jgi:hypothetical protein
VRIQRAEATGVRLTLGKFSMRLILLLAVCTLLGCTTPKVPETTRGWGGSGGPTSMGPAMGSASGNATAPAAGQGAGKRSEKPRATAPELDDSSASDAGVDSEDATDAPEKTSTGAPDAGPALADAAATAEPTPSDGSSPMQDASVLGTWQGRVADAFGRESTICMVVTQSSEPALAGEMTYVGTYNCRANIVFDRVDGYSYWYTQQVLTMSPMCPAGRLRLERKLDGRLDFQSFFGPGEVLDESGTLMAVDSCPDP